MEFGLSVEQEELRALAAKVANDVFASMAIEWDRDSTALPMEHRELLASLGFLGIAIGEEYGGSGGTLLDSLLVLEEFAKVNRVASWQIFEANTGAARVLELHASDGLRKRLLPEITSGRLTMAVSISEPEAGSAATDLVTRARRDGDSYVINGLKRWCTGAGNSELYLVYVRLNDAPGAKGIGAIVVEADRTGVSFGAQEQLMGFRGVGSADIMLDDVRVPAENLVAEAGEFSKLFSAFSIERLGNATHSLAIGQACVDLTGAYIQERQQFGKDLVEFQSVQTTFADMLVDVEAARLLVWRAANDAGRGTPDPFHTSVAKCFANEMAKRVSDRAIQLHGGYGYHSDYHVERHHRDAHGWSIAGGTPTMQRTRIVSEMLGRRFDQRA